MATNQSLNESKFTDAVRYLEEIRIKLANEPHVYNEFVDLLNSFTAKRFVNKNINKI